jgi:hypothetical protein
MPLRPEDLRPEERQSAEILQKWLERVGLKATWEPVEHDPPDLKFTITPDDATTEHWGVKVTGLFQYVDWDGKEANRKDIEIPLDRLCERLKAHVPANVITGYVIFGSGPHDAEMRKIEERAVEYIRSGRTGRELLDLPEAMEKVKHILNASPNDPRLIALVKKTAEANAHFSISAITKPVRVQWGAMLQGGARIPETDTMVADVSATLQYAIGRILDAKLPRLKKVTGYTRKLLLIWSGYFFADGERLKEILDARKLTAQDVDTILLIDGDSELHWVADPAGLFGPCRRPSKDEISICAYDLWERRGRPFGSPEVDWLEAERQLNAGRWRIT